MSHGPTPVQDIETFRIAIPKPVVADLRARLRATRWPNGVTDRTGGFPVAEAARLASHWAESFDRYEQEEKLNALPQYAVDVGDHRIHIVHFRSVEHVGVPLLLLHGWRLIQEALIAYGEDVGLDVAGRLTSNSQRGPGCPQGNFTGESSSNP